MPLNKVKGNMYSWVDATFNTIKGKCPHSCAYCYMKRWGEQPELHFDEKELKTDLGEGNFIFVGSSCDMFAKEISIKWIFDTLEHCKQFDNKYLFQSKNPAGIILSNIFIGLPEDVVLGTTIESNRAYDEMANAPSTIDRATGMRTLHKAGHKTFITIEPVMDFDLGFFVDMIRSCEPNFINIGANTNHKVKLTEPSPEKITALVDKLKGIAEVKVKPNLKRLII